MAGQIILVLFAYQKISSACVCGVNRPNAGGACKGPCFERPPAIFVWLAVCILKLKTDQRTLSNFDVANSAGLFVRTTSNRVVWRIRLKWDRQSFNYLNYNEP